ncbi:MAG: hypothetical protein ACP5O4_05705, partial [bacterium]
RIDEINKRIDETNKRIDETNKRIDNLQFSLNDLYTKYSELTLLVTSIYNQKHIIDDLIIRVQKLKKKLVNKKFII